MSNASSAPIRVVIADADADSMARTRSILLQDDAIGVIGTAAEHSEVLPLLDLEPNIFLLATSIDPHNTTALVKQILELTPRTQVLLVTEDVATVDMRRAMLAGARGILQTPLHASEVLSTIHEIIESQSTRRQRVDEIARQRQAKAMQGRIITTFSPKGGVGCTVLAVNLAVALHEMTKKRVALVDYSLQFGTVSTLLNIQSIHNLAELVPHYEGIDATILGDVMVRHPSGIQVLLPPATLDQVEVVTTESLVGILEGLRNHFDYVIVDSWHAVEDATLAIMEMSDTVLLVTTPEVPALYTTRRFLDMIKGYPALREKPRLVVNRHPSKGGIELSEIEASLGLEALATVPSDGMVVTAAINEGMPVAQKSATSPTLRSLTRLAEALALPADRPTTAQAGGPARRFPTLWRRQGA